MRGKRDQRNNMELFHESEEPESRGAVTSAIH